jgi:hypothetical protein
VREREMIELAERCDIMLERTGRGRDSRWDAWSGVVIRRGVDLEMVSEARI